MNQLYIPPTYKDPLIDFNPNGILWLKGRSIPEDAYDFYGDLIDWVKQLCDVPPDKVVFNIELTNHNDGASKFLIQILHLLKEGISDFGVNWYYEEWDDEIIFLGNSIAEVTDVDFNFVEIENDSKKT